MKRNTKCRIWVVWEIRVIGNATIR